MTIEEFQQIIAAHGGLRDQPARQGPATVKRTSKDRYGRETTTDEPVQTPPYRYIFNDGTTLEAVTQESGDVQVTNPGTALNKAGVAAAAGADKPIEVGGKLVQRQPNGEYTTVWDPATAGGAPKPIEIGGQIVQQQPDGSYKTIWSPEAKPTPPPSITVPAPRAGQRTDLAAVKAASDVYIAGLWADKSLTDAQRMARFQQYYETTIRPAFERATAEINTEADRLTRKQEEQTAYERLSEREKEETRQREARLGFGYTAGRDAVSDAMKLLPYETGPSFGPELAGIYNQILGAGTFSPGAFNFPRPDTEAIAQRNVDRAMALYDTSVPQRATTGVMGAAGPPGQAALMHSGAASTAAAMANVPFTPRPAVTPAAPAQVAMPTAYPSATPGVGPGVPSPLPPGWENLYPRPANI